MFTMGLGLTLRPGAYEGYKRAHDELWPELAEGMRANEVSMAIYRDGNRLFVFAAAPSEACSPPAPKGISCSEFE